MSSGFSTPGRNEYFPGLRAVGVRSEDLDRFLEVFFAPGVAPASLVFDVEVLVFFFAGEFEGDESLLPCVRSSSPSNLGLLMSLMMELRSAASS